MKNLPYRIEKIDIAKLSSKEYFYEIKRKFIIGDHRYKGSDGGQGIDLTLDDITMYIGDIEDAKVEEVKFNFFEDYLKKATRLSVAEYKKSFLKGLETIKNYTPTAIQNHFNQHEVNIKTIISDSNSISILKTNKFNEFLESELQSVLDDINTIKQQYLSFPKIHLNLSKTQALLFFHALLQNNVIVGSSPADLFRMVEDYFTYRDESVDKPIPGGSKALSDYLTGHKNVASNTLSELERKLDGMSEYLHKKFGEK